MGLLDDEDGGRHEEDGLAAELKDAGDGLADLGPRGAEDLLAGGGEGLEGRGNSGCGGVPGYAEFVQAMADPDNPEHDNLAEWIGADTWDPAAFDSIEVNDRLAGIKV